MGGDPQGPAPGEEVAIYYVAVVELNDTWVENQTDHADLKDLLDGKMKLGGIGFRGIVHKSVLLKDISKLKGVGRLSERGGR